MREPGKQAFELTRSVNALAAWGSAADEVVAALSASVDAARGSATGWKKALDAAVDGDAEARNPVNLAGDVARKATAAAKNLVEEAKQAAAAVQAAVEKVQAAVLAALAEGAGDASARLDRARQSADEAAVAIEELAWWVLRPMRARCWHRLPQSRMPRPWLWCRRRWPRSRPPQAASRRHAWRRRRLSRCGAWWTDCRPG